MSSSKPQILVILTSHDALGDTGKKTGWYLPELAHPWKVLESQFALTIASPLGGNAPLDPSSVEAFANDEICKEFLANDEIMNAVKNTKKLSDVQSIESYVAVLLPGGHGPMFDLAVDATSQKLIASFYEADKVVASVCHGPAALVNVKLSNGDFLVKGKKVTAFSNAEEDAVGLTKAMPFALESQLVANGGIFEKASEDWACHTVVDGKLITGQNPASSTELAQHMVASQQK